MMQLPSTAGRACVVAAVLASFALAPVGQAHADSTPAVDFSFTLTSQQPAMATSALLHIVYKNPSDPNAKPPPVTQLTLEAPPGSRFDGTAVPACTASDSMIMSQGPSACPTASKVGSGTALAITGFGPPTDPVAFNAALFNTGDGIVEVYTGKSTPITAIDRLKFTNSYTQTTNPPVNPGGPPDGHTSIKQLDLTYSNVRGPSGKAFLTTPPKCPPNRTWTSYLTFSTLNNPYPYSATSTAPCAPRSTTATPKMRLKVRPREVRIGKLVRLRFRVFSAEPHCKRRATVRFDGKHARTSRDGKATITITIRRRGRYVARVTNAGCRRASTSVTALKPAQVPSEEIRSMQKA